MKSIDIERLIPQRNPIRMVDELKDVTGDETQTSFTVRPDCFFLGGDGLMEESGIVENIAQSASAFAGYKAFMAGETEPPVGYIAEVKNFRCYHRPAVGDALRTIVRLGPEAEGVTLLFGETYIGDTLVAETQMKIFIRPGD